MVGHLYCYDLTHSSQNTRVYQAVARGGGAGGGAPPGKIFAPRRSEDKMSLGKSGYGPESISRTKKMSLGIKKFVSQSVGSRPRLSEAN